MLVLSGAGWAGGGGGECGRGRELPIVGGQQRRRRHLSQEEEKGGESLQVSSPFSLDSPLRDMISVPDPVVFLDPWIRDG